MRRYVLLRLCVVLASIRIGNGETNWYDFANLSPQERQRIVDAITKTCAEVPLLQQPFWRHQPELYRVSPQEHLLPQRHHEHSRVSNLNCEVHGLLRRCRLGDSKEPQHRRLQEEQPAGDEEPAPSEDKPLEDDVPPDAQADWVEPDLGIAGTAEVMPSVLDEPDTDEISDAEAEETTREALGELHNEPAGEGPSDVDDLQEAEELSEEAGIEMMEAPGEAEPEEAEPQEAEPQEAEQEEPGVRDAEAREEQQLMEDLDRQQEGPSQHDIDILEKAEMLREQQLERMAEESSEPTEPEAPELKYWQKEAAQQEAAAGAADRAEVGEDRETDLALTPRERHHEHHVDAEKHAVLRRAFLGETTTSSEAYMKATRAHGDPHRLSTFFKKLLNGNAVSVAAIGGTVTAGGGAGGRHKQQGYAGRVATWLESLGSEQEPVNVTFRNMAVEGTTSVYMAQCLHNLVANGTDPILVEPSVGDWAALDLDRTDEGVRAPLNNSIRRGFERLLRRLMRLPGAPAVLVVHWWSPLEFQGSFWEVAQDELDVIASYYDVQTISFRDGYYNEIMSAKTGFAPETFLCDSTNPNPLGHRYLADLVVSYLQDVLAAAVLGVGHTSHATGGHATALPPPMFPGNDGTPDALCINPGHDFKLLVTSHDGWLWVNEAQVEMNHPPRWGFIAATPGKVLTLQFPMPKPPQTLPDGAEEGGMPMTVGVGMLKSYQHMGVAEVACTQGCSCEPQAFDLHQEEKRSLVFFHYMEVRWAPQCSMSITVAEETSSGEHKVKVTSLIVSDDYRDQSHVYSLRESAVATDQHGITGRRLLVDV